MVLLGLVGRVFTTKDTKITKERRLNRRGRKEFGVQIVGLLTAQCLPLPELRKAGSFGSQISEPFVSFVILWLKVLGERNQGESARISTRKPEEPKL
jgi:hypothetical protein